MSTTQFQRSRRNKVVRHPERGHYDRETVYSILDEALICHVGFVQDEHPFVIPTLHARDGDRLLLHGSSASRMVQHLSAGNSACVTVTLIDALVLARTVFDHSVNYRSVLVFGQGQGITDPDEKRYALRCFMEKQLPGRWDDARQPTDQELKATGVVQISLEAASAKVRTGPPKDEGDDLSLPVWAGVVPMYQVMGAPIGSPDAPPDQPLPDYLQAFLRARRNGTSHA